MRPEGPPSKRTAKENHRAFSAENEELTTIVTRPQASSCPLAREDHPGPPMMRILQLNLNHCEAAQDLLCDIISSCASTWPSCVSNTRTLLHPTQWLADADGQAAIWVHGGIPVQEAPSASTSLLRVGPNRRNFSFFSVYAPPRLSERGIFRPPCQHHRGGPAAEGPLLLRGTSKRMVDGVGM
ncbi:unnamed protein product [Trichogramma brassicae]|uniref:Uncharacterized protein n=1 Tax=Trichogramma brassicae TaxID=86971 RepID=A0A6H5J0P3_9HYME|nr:unnamed protein product [Trichogramma brassicae]